MAKAVREQQIISQTYWKYQIKDTFFFFVPHRFAKEEGESQDFWRLFALVSKQILPKTEATVENRDTDTGA